jgi:hypothetical protein
VRLEVRHDSVQQDLMVVLIDWRWQGVHCVVGGKIDISSRASKHLKDSQPIGEENRQSVNTA